MTEEEARRFQPPHVTSRTISGSNRPHDPAFCCATVPGEWPFSSQCSRKPKVFYGSLGYCGSHDPQKQKAKRERWAAESRAEDAKRKYERDMREYTAACVELVEAASSLDLDTHPSSFADLGVIVKNMKRIVAKKPTSAEAQGE